MAEPIYNKDGKLIGFEPPPPKTLQIICDKNDVVQDIATEAVNLSRGLTFADYKGYADVPVQLVADIRVGDTFKNNVLTKNQAIRIESEKRQQDERKIQGKIRAKAIEQLIADGELPSDYQES